jgi:L-malate glycosyltransferase
MRVLFYNHTAQVSGAERVLLAVLKHLDRGRFEPLVLCPAEGPMREMAEAQGVECYALEQLEARFTWSVRACARYLASFRRAIKQARARVVELQPDVIHANSIRAGLVMAAATTGLRVPVVGHLHDLLPRHPFSAAIRLFALLSSRNRMLAVSQAVADRFQGLLLRCFQQRVPVAVMRNAVELDRFAPDEGAARAVREELGLGDDAPLVGIVGQITERKGQLELIRAFAAVLKQIPQATLLVVGAPLFNRSDEEYRDKLVATAQQLGVADRVRFTGPRKDVAAIYQALDVLVVNSWAEPFALVVLEGMASGAAMVATAVGGTPEMIEHGEQGWLVKAGDEAGLAEAVATLLARPALRAHFSKQGRCRARVRFSFTHYIRRLEDFYREAAARREGPSRQAAPQHSSTS